MDNKEYSLLTENIRELCKTRQGKEFVWFVLAECNLYSDTFTGNSNTFYLEGKRAVGLSILQALEDADPTLYPRLLLEKAKQNEGKNG